MKEIEEDNGSIKEILQLNTEGFIDDLKTFLDNHEIGNLMNLTVSYKEFQIFEQSQRNGFVMRTSIRNRNIKQKKHSLTKKNNRISGL